MQIIGPDVIKYNMVIVDAQLDKHQFLTVRVKGSSHTWGSLFMDDWY